MTLGSLLRTMRHQRRLSQRQLATRLGTSVRKISRWENDHDYPWRSQLSALDGVLNRPIVERAYLDVSLPELLKRLLVAGEVATKGHRRPPTDFAVERNGRLVATPFLLETAQTTPTVEALVDQWLNLVDAEAGKPILAWEKRDAFARKLAADEICVAHEQRLQLDIGYLDHPLPPPGRNGVLQRNLMCGVQRPILPRPAAASAGSTLRIGRFIPVLREPVTLSEPFLRRQLLDDPVHAAVMLLATCSRFPSTEINTALLDTSSGLLLDVEDSQRTWSGSLSDGVAALLHTVDFVCVRPFCRDGWVETTRLAFDDLVREQLLSVNGPCVEVNEVFWSSVAAKPGHRLNRGEKLSRARVSERLLHVLSGDTDG